MPDSSRELVWLRRLRDLAHRLAAERDRRRLPPLILDAAVELTGAERGFLVLVEPGPRGPRLKVETARGFDKARILAGANKVSRTAVMRAMNREGPVLTSSEADQDLAGVTSIRERHVRAILCVPMRVRERTLGVVYLDHRFDAGVFVPEHLPVVAAFADQAALALETSELEAARARQTEALGSARAAVQEEQGRRRGQAELSRRGWSPGKVVRHGRLVGSSPAAQLLSAAVDRAARSPAPLLIVGETGTGKELVAREVHDRSPRAGQPFQALSCAALPHGRLEPERFLEAGGGTLFLDEVGELSPEAQVVLLHALAEGRVPRLAGAPVPVACRVAAATRQDLAARVEAGALRADLYYRLDVLRLVVPPLRERSEDVPALLTHFLAQEQGLPGAIELEPEAFQALLDYRWPGNARELQNEARRLAAQLAGADPARVGLGQLSAEVRGASPAGPATWDGKTLPEVERALIVDALRRADGNKSRAARLVGIPRSTLQDLIKRHGLAP